MLKLNAPFLGDQARYSTTGRCRLVLSIAGALVCGSLAPAFGATGASIVDAPPAFSPPKGHILLDQTFVSLRGRFRQALQEKLGGRLSESRRLFEALLPDYPVMATPIRRHLSMIAAAQGRHLDSLKWATRLLEGEGVDPLKLRTPNGAFNLYFGSEIAWGLLLRGESLYRLGRSREAVDSIGPSLSIVGKGAPALARRYLYYGRSLFQSGETVPAIQALAHSNSEDPTGVFGGLARKDLSKMSGVSKETLGSVEERFFLDELETLLEARAYNKVLGRAKARAQVVQSTEGQRSFLYLQKMAQAALLPGAKGVPALEALAATPYLTVDEYWGVVEALATLMRRARDPAGQKDILQRFLQTFPMAAQSAEGRMQLAAIYQDQGRVAEAEALFAEVARLFPQDPKADDARWVLAWSRFEQGDMAGAYLHLKAHTKTVVPGSRADARATYWLGRAAEKIGRSGLSWWLYADVARRFPDTYYGNMASWRSAGGIPRFQASQGFGQPPIQVPIPRETHLLDGGTLNVDDPPWRIARALLFPGFLDLLGGIKDAGVARSLARAMELSLSGLMAGAYTALSDTRLNPRTGSQGKLVLAAFYQGLGQLQRGMILGHESLEGGVAPTASGLRERRHALAYPTPFLDLFLREAYRQGIEPVVLLAMAQQESGFWPTARSVANARGLLQVIPRTARAMAKKEGLGTPSTAELFRPSLNVRLGASYLRDMLNQFGGNLPRALAAYNAGPGAVERWLRRLGKGVENDVFIEEIPYTETRDYARVVLRNFGGYRGLYQNIQLTDDVVKVARQLPKAVPVRQGKERQPPGLPAKVAAEREDRIERVEALPEVATPTPEADEPGGLVGPGGIFEW